MWVVWKCVLCILIKRNWNSGVNKNVTKNKNKMWRISTSAAIAAAAVLWINRHKPGWSATLRTSHAPRRLGELHNNVRDTSDIRAPSHQNSKWSCTLLSHTFSFVVYSFYWFSRINITDNFSSTTLLNMTHSFVLSILQTPARVDFPAVGITRCIRGSR